MPWPLPPRRRTLVVALGVLLLLIAWLAATAARGPRVEAMRVVRGPVVQRVIANGRVWVPYRARLGPVTGGRVARLAADEGSRVAPGDTLLELDNAEQRAEAAEAAARLRRLRETDRLAADAALARARTELTQAERRLRRSEELRAGGAVAPEDHDEARDARDLAQARVDEAAARAAAFAAGGAEERLAAAQLAAAVARLEHTVVTAPAAGLVIERLAAAGDVVQGGQTLLVMAPADSTWLTVQPEEKSLAWLRPGQEALAATDAYPRRTFRAVVARIAPAVDEKRGTIEVRLLVPDPPAWLLPDMTVSIDVAAESRESALLLPAEAVRDAESPRPWALVVRDGRARRAEVRAGLRGEGLVEIVEGLAEGDLVVPATAAAVREGQRVRARAPRRGGR